MKMGQSEPSTREIVGRLILFAGTVIGVAALATEGVALLLLGAIQLVVTLPIIVWAAVTGRKRWLSTTLVFAGALILLNGVGCGVLILVLS